MITTPPLQKQAFTGPDGNPYLFIAAAAIVPAEPSIHAMGVQFEPGQVTVLQGTPNNTETLNNMRSESSALIPVVLNGGDFEGCMDMLRKEALSVLQQHVTQASMKVGDKVSWMHTKSTSGGFDLSHREGTIVEIKGKIAVCKMKNGRKGNVKLSNLTPEGETGALTKFFARPEKPTGVQARVTFDYDFTEQVQMVNEDRERSGEKPLTPAEVEQFIADDLADYDFNGEEVPIVVTNNLNPPSQQTENE